MTTQKLTKEEKQAKYDAEWAAMTTGQKAKSIFSLFFVLFIIGASIAAYSSDENTNLTPREQKVQAQFSPWDGSHYALTTMIKKAMNDPDSFQHIETRVFKNGQDKIIVIEQYRGKNGFGAMVKGFVKAKFDLEGNLIEIIEQG